MSIISIETSELSKLSSIKRFKYALAYTIMQKLCRVAVPQVVYGSEEDIKKINIENIYSK